MACKPKPGKNHQRKNNLSLAQRTRAPRYGRGCREFKSLTGGQHLKEFTNE